VANGDDTVSVIDVATNSATALIPLGAGNEPFGVAVTPDGRSVYITNFATNTVSVIATATNTVIVSSIPVGISPEGVAITPDGRFAYVANFGSGTVSVINTATNAVATISVGGAPQGIAITPNGNFVYIANQSDNTVSVINTITNQVVSIPVGSTPVGVAITPDGRFAYVTNSGDNTVSVIEVGRNAVLQTIGVGNQPSSFGAFIGPNLIVAQGGPLLIANDSALTTLGFGTFVDFNGGTMRTTGSLISSRTISLLALGGIIDTNGFDSIFSGDIINSGSLTKIGTGTLTLSGNNSYSGGTNIFGGVLSVSSDANLGTGNINIGNNAELLTTGATFSSGKAIALGNGGGTLASATGATATYGGVISGTGPLSIGDGINQGTVVLNAANTYSGGTIVLAGTLQAGSAGGFVSNTAYTVIGGTLNLNNFNLTMSSLDGTGGVVNLGSAALTINDTGMDVYSGIVQGTGSLTKIGAGALTLSGKNTYSGGTLINAGTLVVNNAQALGLGNVVVSGGVLTVEAQRINVGGNYTQNAGGALQLGLGSSAPDQNDFLNVGGQAALGGTLQLLSLNGFRPKIGSKLTLVLAAGGVSGQFANVLDPFSSLLRLDLVYQPNSVVLEFASDFTAFAQTPNQRAVAIQLDAVAFDPRETQLISFLQNEPLSNLGRDFERISPDSLSALYEISFSAANVQAANLENRFAEIRNGSTGFASSLNISTSSGALVEGGNGKAMIEPSQNVLTPSPENKWGVWISGSGDFVKVSGDGNGKGYDFSTGGVTFGLDYRLTKNFALGIAARYAHTWTSLIGNGNVDVDSGGGGLYATFSQGGFYLNGYAGGAHNSYDTRRDALGGGASGSTSGGEFDGYAGGGYEFHCGGFNFGPIASLQYTYVDVSGYNETSSLAPLRIVSQNQDSLRTNVGLSASYTWKAGKVQLSPNLRASWQHEYFYSALPISAEFASGAGSVFTVYGPAEGHDSAVIDAGLDVQWTPTIGTYFGYNGQVGRSNYDSHAVICSVHIDL
jgi:outer membrane autotransporter protein